MTICGLKAFLRDGKATPEAFEVFLRQKEAKNSFDPKNDCFDTPTAKNFTKLVSNWVKMDCTNRTNQKSLLKRFASAMNSMYILAKHNEICKAFPLVFYNNLVPLLYDLIGRLFQFEPKDSNFVNGFSPCLGLLKEIIHLQRGIEAAAMLVFSRMLEFLSLYVKGGAYARLPLDLLSATFDTVSSFLPLWISSDLREEARTSTLERVRPKSIRSLPVLLESLFDIGDFSFQSTILVAASVITFPDKYEGLVAQALRNRVSSQFAVNKCMKLFRRIFEETSFERKMATSASFLHTSTSLFKSQEVISIPLKTVHLEGAVLLCPKVDDTNNSQQSWCEVNSLTRRLSFLYVSGSNQSEFFHVYPHSVVNTEHTGENVTLVLKNLPQAMASNFIVEEHPTVRLTLFPGPEKPGLDLVSCLKTILPFGSLIDTVQRYRYAYGGIEIPNSASSASDKHGVVQKQAAREAASTVVGHFLNIEELPEITPSIYSAEGYSRKCRKVLKDKNKVMSPIVGESIEQVPHPVASAEPPVAERKPTKARTSGNGSKVKALEPTKTVVSENKKPSARRSQPQRQAALRALGAIQKSANSEETDHSITSSVPKMISQVEQTKEKPDSLQEFETITLKELPEEMTSATCETKRGNKSVGTKRRKSSGGVRFTFDDYDKPSERQPASEVQPNEGNLLSCINCKSKRRYGRKSREAELAKTADRHFIMDIDEIPHEKSIERARHAATFHFSGAENQSNFIAAVEAESHKQKRGLSEAVEKPNQNDLAGTSIQIICEESSPPKKKLKSRETKAKALKSKPNALSKARQVTPSRKTKVNGEKTKTGKQTPVSISEVKQEQLETWPEGDRCETISLLNSSTQAIPSNSDQLPTTDESDHPVKPSQGCVECVIPDAAHARNMLGKLLEDMTKHHRVLVESVRFHEEAMTSVGLLKEAFSSGHDERMRQSENAANEIVSQSEKLSPSI